MPYGNLRISLRLIFYVKSILKTLGFQKLKFYRFRGSTFGHWQFLALINGRAPKNVKMAIFGTYGVQNLISRKILVAEKS